MTVMTQIQMTTTTQTRTTQTQTIPILTMTRTRTMMTMIPMTRILIQMTRIRVTPTFPAAARLRLNHQSRTVPVCPPANVLMPTIRMELQSVRSTRFQIIATPSSPPRECTGVATLMKDGTQPAPKWKWRLRIFSWWLECWEDWSCFWFYASLRVDVYSIKRYR